MLEVSHTTPPDVVVVELVKQLDAFGVDYAVGGALAIGLWSKPRSTLDVDITPFLDPKLPEQCVSLLESIGCAIDKVKATAMLREFGYCKVAWRDCTVDIFLPTIPFLPAAKHRRSNLLFRGREVRFWNAEVMAALKMMFFRDKDFVDLEKLIRAQSANLDRIWVRQRLAEVFGDFDPRLSTWDELCPDVDSNS